MKTRLIALLFCCASALQGATPHVQVSIASFTLNAETTNQPVRLEPNRTVSAVAIQRGVTDTAGQITFSNMPAGQYSLFLPQSGVQQLTLEVPDYSGTLDASTIVTTPGWVGPEPSGGTPIPPNLFRGVPYLWPASQGAVGTVITNDGAGNLGWARVGGVYSDNAAYTNLNAAGTMSNLASVTIAGNTITNTGDAFAGEWEGQLRNTFVSTNQFQIVFGSQTILDTGAQAVSNIVFSAWARVRRLSGTDAQRAYAHFEWGPGGGVPFAFTNATVDLVQTNGIDTVFALKGGAFGLGSHTNNSFELEIKRAP